MFGPLDGELLDDRRGGSLRRVVEDLVDALVDDLGGHGRSEDDRSLLVAVLDPDLRKSFLSLTICMRKTQKWLTLAIAWAVTNWPKTLAS